MVEYCGVDLVEVGCVCEVLIVCEVEFGRCVVEVVFDF